MQSSRAAIYHVRASRLVKPFLLGLLCDGRLGPASFSLQPQSGCQSLALTGQPHTRQHTVLTEAQSKVGTGTLLRSEVAFPRDGVIVFERLNRLLGNGKIIKEKIKL